MDCKQAFVINLELFFSLNNSPTIPPENAEQDWDGGDPREQRGDVGGQGPHLEELLCFEQVGLSNNLFVMDLPIFVGPDL